MHDSVNTYISYCLPTVSAEICDRINKWSERYFFNSNFCVDILSTHINRYKQKKTIYITCVYLSYYIILNYLSQRILDRSGIRIYILRTITCNALIISFLSYNVSDFYSKRITDESRLIKYCHSKTIVLKNIFVVTYECLHFISINN